jgi:hypothetical protein
MGIGRVALHRNLFLLSVVLLICTPTEGLVRVALKQLPVDGNCLVVGEDARK